VDAPRYVPGFVAVVITAIVAAGFIAAYRLVCILDNRKRDKSGIMEGFEHAYEDDLTDMKVSAEIVEFRDCLLTFVI
jgi:hypothetical protein